MVEDLAGCEVLVADIDGSVLQLQLRMFRSLCVYLLDCGSHLQQDVFMSFGACFDFVDPELFV